MTITRILAPFRAVHDRLRKADPEALAKAEMYKTIRIHLRDTRRQLYILERIVGNLPAGEFEAVSLEIKSLKEREHALIKSAKVLCGEKINIPTSLLEYESNTLSRSPH